MKRIIAFSFFSFLVLNLYSQKTELKPYWDNGLKFSGKSKDFSVKIGGRIQYDLMMMRQDDSLDNHFDANPGAEFRRARLFTSGTVYKTIKYKFQVDFAGNRVVIKDAYIRLTKIPYIGNITLGNFKEPRSFQMITSSKYITMMERSLTNQFDNDRNLGVMVNNQFFDRSLSLYTGYFYPSGNNAKYIGKEYNLAFRLVGIPYYIDEKNNFKVIHLDAGFTYENHDNRKASYSARPESHLAPKYLNVEMDESKSLIEYNGGLVAIFNSLSFQGEYTYADVNTGPSSVLEKDKYGLFSFYGTLSWFVTGEHKNYSKKKVAFDKIKPKKNFADDSGLGAWEVAIRYSIMNLNDGDLQGGKMNNVTLGINWYLNPITKVAFNYIHSDIFELGIANIYQMRFQIGF
ncbi:MAG: hypothetical protein GXO88_12915 [Chlorobi bacterium]|nr:hypothetical protein [Chlorobiota bacterium]